jgi:ABC-2 type transport system permease protein
MMNLARRVIRQMRGDKRSIALIVFAPLLIITLVYFLLGDSGYTPKIALDKYNTPSAVVSALSNHDVEIIAINSDIDITQYLKDKKADAILSVSQSGAAVHMLESNSKSAKAMTAVKNAIAILNPRAGMEVTFVYGSENDTTFDMFGYVFLGIFSFFFVFIISGISLVRERSSGTLERLLMTRIKRVEVIMGYTIGYGVFAVIQAVLIVLYSVFVLGVSCQGDALWVVLLMVLMAVAAVSFGAMLSIFANSEFQVLQFIPIVLVPQIFFSGLIPLDTIPYGLGNICYITPVYYGCAAIKRVMIENAGFSAIWPFALALLAYTAVLVAINTAALKKYRRL